MGIRFPPTEVMMVCFLFTVTSAGPVSQEKPWLIMTREFSNGIFKPHFNLKSFTLCTYTYVFVCVTDVSTHTLK